MVKRKSGDGDSVGYGRPPAKAQFKKGQSGNPKGRPKGALNKKTVERKILDLPVRVDQGGKTKLVSTYEGVLLKVRADALNGDARARSDILKLYAAVQESDDRPADQEVTGSDLEVFEDLVRRIRAEGAVERDTDEESGSEK